MLFSADYQGNASIKIIESLIDGQETRKMLQRHFLTNSLVWNIDTEAHISQHLKLQVRNTDAPTEHVGSSQAKRMREVEDAQPDADRLRRDKPLTTSPPAALNLVWRTHDWVLNPAPMNPIFHSDPAETGLKKTLLFKFS